MQNEVQKVLVSPSLSLFLSLFLTLYYTSLCSVIPWNISQSWFSHSSSTVFLCPVSSVLFIIFPAFTHIFISLHPLICSLQNLLILDPEYTLTLLMLQSPFPCFDDVHVFQLPSPTCRSDVYPFWLLFLCCRCFFPTLVQHGQKSSVSEYLLV